MVVRRVFTYVFIVISVVYLLLRYVGGIIFVDVPSDIVGSLVSRYGGSFSFVGFLPDRGTVNSKVAEVKGELGNFTIERYYTEDGECHYNDSYLGYIYRDRLLADIRECLDVISGDYIFDLDLGSSTFPDSTFRGMDYSSFTSSSSSLFCVNVVSRYEWSDLDIERFTRLVMDRGINVVVNILYCKEDFIDLVDFDYTVRLDSSLGRRLSFSVSGEGLLYVNRS